MNYRLFAQDLSKSLRIKQIPYKFAKQNGELCACVDGAALLGAGGVARKAVKDYAKAAYEGNLGIFKAANQITKEFQRRYGSNQKSDESQELVRINNYGLGNFEEILLYALFLAEAQDTDDLADILAAPGA